MSLKRWDCKPSNAIETIYAYLPQIFRVMWIIRLQKVQNIHNALLTVRKLAAWAAASVYVLDSAVIRSLKLVLDCVISAIFKDYYLSISRMRWPQENFHWLLELTQWWRVLQVRLNKEDPLTIDLWLKKFTELCLSHQSAQSRHEQKRRPMNRNIVQRRPVVHWHFSFTVKHEYIL